MSNHLNIIKDNAIQEVIELHQMIENCFCNRLETIDGAKKEFMEHFHPNFCMITPSGKMLNKSDLETWFTQAVGTRDGNIITIVNPTVQRIVGDNTIIVTFEEEQRFGSEFLRRISTAILTQKTNSQNLSWLHLHETGSIH